MAGYFYLTAIIAICIMQIKKNAANWKLLCVPHGSFLGF
jgi:hypothetical protein